MHAEGDYINKYDQQRTKNNHFVVYQFDTPT